MQVPLLNQISHILTSMKHLEKILIQGNAVQNSEEIFNKGFMLGKTLSKLTDHLLIGESTPAGTTTALRSFNCYGL